MSYNDSATCFSSSGSPRAASLRDVFETVTVEMLATGELPPAIIKLTKDDEAWKPH